MGFSFDDDDLEELLALRHEEPAASDPFGRPVVWVCLCRCVEQGEMEAILADGGGFEDIVCRTGATTGCGGCEASVRALVVESRARR